MKNNILKTILATLLAFTITYCNGENSTANDPVTATYTLSVNVTGYNATNFTMLNSDAQEVGVTANGTVSFPTAIASGTSYSVTVKAQPSDAYCTVTSGNGTMSAALTVAVSCSKLGYSWVEKNAGLTNKALRGIAHGNSNFVIVGDYDGTNDPTILVSSDSTINFTAVTVAAANVNTRLNAVIYGGSKFVAVGNSGYVYTSTDGLAWSISYQKDVNYTFTDIVYSNNQFVAVGKDTTSGTKGLLCYSADASNVGSWTCTTTGLGTQPLNAVAYNGTLYLTGGENQALYLSSSNNLGTATWAAKTLGGKLTATMDVNDIDADGSGFILSAEDSINDFFVCETTTVNSCTAEFNSSYFQILKTPDFYLGTKQTVNIGRLLESTWQSKVTIGGVLPGLEIGNNKILATNESGKIYLSE